MKEELSLPLSRARAPSVMESCALPQFSTKTNRTSEKSYLLECGVLAANKHLLVNICFKMCICKSNMFIYLMKTTKIIVSN